MKLPELKAEARAKGIKGFSTMKKAALIDYLELMEKPKRKPAKVAPVESAVLAIKAALRIAREDRSSKGRKAGMMATKTSMMMPDAKADNYALQRGSMSAKLTSAQARRVRKAERKQGSNIYA